MFTQKIIQEFLQKEKVTIHKLRDGVSLIEQDTIEHVSWLIQNSKFIMSFEILDYSKREIQSFKKSPDIFVQIQQNKQISLLCISQWLEILHK